MSKSEDKEIIKTLRSAEDYLRTLADKLEKLGDKHEFPLLIAEINKLKKGEKVTTAWLQKKYKMGYARASRLEGQVNKKKTEK